jgi:dolichol-phosphate mannosyltransferase
VEPAPEVSVLLPTINEAGSLRVIAGPLLAALAPYRSEILVIDDASTDGTAEVVGQLAERGPFRLLERREERGLSSAVLAGIAATTGPIIVVMDADGSHPPELLSRLIDPVRSNAAEFALASRHIPGGDVGQMSATRRAISSGAALLARPLANVKDPMSGFFCVRRDILGRATLRPLGFKIALEILVKCRPRPVVEVPFGFRDRVYGESKLGSRVIGSYLRHVARLYAWRIAGGRAASSTR